MGRKLRGDVGKMSDTDRDGSVCAVNAAKTPAVVLGAGVNGLGIARSLALARVQVWLLDSDERRPEMQTRAAKPLGVRNLHGTPIIEELVRLGTTKFSGMQPVLFLTQEESVKTVSQHRERLSALYRFRLPRRDVVDALLHKQRFQQLAEQFDSPIPPLVHIRSLADLSLLEKLRYPVVVKPGERHAEYSRRFKKAYRVETVENAAELLRHILPVMPDVVVQEWIEGPDSCIYFCLQYLGLQGQVVASFTGRKIRAWPPQVGGTASCTAASDVHDELSQFTERFFRNAGVVGMAGMEYKRDTRNGKFLMIEPTIGRSDYQEEVATLNGVNLPYAAYCFECGLVPPEPIRISRPVVWRVLSEDRQSAALQGQALSHGVPSSGRVVDAVRRWNDPMPFMVQNLRRIQRRLFGRAWNAVPAPRRDGNKP